MSIHNHIGHFISRMRGHIHRPNFYGCNHFPLKYVMRHEPFGPEMHHGALVMVLSNI